MITLYLIILVMLILALFVRRQTALFVFDQNETLPLRGGLAVCVLICHLCPYFSEENVLFNDWCTLGPVSVAAFFLLTGYGLGISYKNKGKSYLKGFFSKRMSRLLMPFLIMTLIFQVYVVCNKEFSLYGMLVRPFPRHWFIYALIIWYVAYYAVFNYFREIKKALLAIWLFTAVYVAAFVMLHDNLYWVSIFPLPICLTYVFYEEKVRVYFSKHRFLILTAALLLLLVGVAYVLYSKLYHPLPAWGPISYTYLPFYFIILTYVYGGWNNRFTNFLGTISYEFYIVHGFVVLLIGEYHDFGLGVIGCFMSIFLAISISSFFGYVIHRIA